MKLLSLFSGIGAFEKALDNIGIDYDLVNYCEVDKYTSSVYSAIHNIPKEDNLGDIEKVTLDKFNNIDLITWGFPCQDFSVANRNGQRGLEGKYSGLYYEGLNFVKTINPKYSLIENVNSLKGTQLQVILNDLSELGYNNYYKVLDAQNYGLPQRRKRLFIVSIRQDLNQEFIFPKRQKLTENMSDYLETNPNEKYYKVNESIIERVINKNLNKGVNNKVVCNTITKAIARQGSSKEFILNCSLIYHLTGEIRRMTPLEAWRLMGFDDEDYYKGKKTLEEEYYNGRDMSDTRMYNMSANSIAVAVLENIFKELFINKTNKRLYEEQNLTKIRKSLI